MSQDILPLSQNSSININPSALNLETRCSQIYLYIEYKNLNLNLDLIMMGFFFFTQNM